MTVAKPSQIGPLKRYAAQRLGIPEQVVEEAQKGLMPVVRQHGGAILVPKGGVEKTMREVSTFMGREMPQMSGEGRKALNIAVGHHEGFERGVTNPMPGHGHLSPEVLMHEHNMMQKMTGPGSSEAKATLGGLRQTVGDMPQLMQGVEHLYGPRGLELVKNQGFTKAMKKNLIDAVRSGKIRWG